VARSGKGGGGREQGKAGRCGEERRKIQEIFELERKLRSAGKRNGYLKGAGKEKQQGRQEKRMEDGGDSCNFRGERGAGKTKNVFYPLRGSMN